MEKKLIDYIQGFMIQCSQNFCLLRIREEVKATLSLDNAQEKLKNQLCNPHSCLCLEPGQKLENFLCPSFSDLCPAHVLSRPHSFAWLFVFWKSLGFLLQWICPQRSTITNTMQGSQPVPHAVRVTICLHHEGQSGLLEGLRPGDGEAPATLIFFHKHVWASLEK